MQISTITPKQCRSARELLGWKQLDLSKSSQTGISTIRDFERGFRELAPKTNHYIKLTFEEAGIIFLNDDEGIGVKLINQDSD